jgi:hypothetical protein
MSEFAKVMVPILQVILFLMPGLIALAVHDYLRAQHREDKLEKFILALVFSVVCRAPLVPLASLRSNPKLLEPFSVTGFGTPPSALAFSVAFPEAILLIGLALLTGMASAWIVHSEVFIKFAANLHITKMSKNQSIWRDTWEKIADSDYAIINYSDGRRLYGKPWLFPDAPGGTSLTLHDAGWLIEGSTEPPQNRGVILVVDTGLIDNIEFLRAGNDTSD